MQAFKSTVGGASIGRVQTPVVTQARRVSRLVPAPQPSPSSSSAPQVCFASPIEAAAKAVAKAKARTLESLEFDAYDDEVTCLGDDCPKIVAEVMREEVNVLTCKPEETLEEIMARLDQVTGLPVITNDGRDKLMGVISRKDIIKVRKAKGSMQDTVAMHMTSPAISIDGFSTVAAAGDLMLKKKIRRLPVVDEEGVPIGLISRTDIFKPLMMEAYKEYLELEIAAIHGDDEVAADKARKTKKSVTWTIKYLYDGDCPMCMSLMTVLKRQDKKRGIIKFVNIADPKYKPKNNMGISYDEAMETIHAIQSDGNVLMGTEALKSLFDSVGLGWATRLSELPILTWLVDVVYDFLTANRLNLGPAGGLLDAVIASKRMSMSQAGIETCGDVDEECSVEW